MTRKKKVLILLLAVTVFLLCAATCRDDLDGTAGDDVDQLPASVFSRGERGMVDARATKYWATTEAEEGSD